MTSTSLATLARRAAELGDPLPCSGGAALWFSELPADLELAKASCGRCPLRLPCLAGAIERAEPSGVWGGEIFDKGRVIAFKRPRGNPGRRADRLRPGPAGAGLPPLAGEDVDQVSGRVAEDH